MAIIHDIGQTPSGHIYFMVQDAMGEPRVCLGSVDMIEELARDLLDYVGRDYCLPYICDHLETMERLS